MGPEYRDRLGAVDREMTCAANTLILTNNVGFHRRGRLVPATHRETLWVNFYPCQRPFYGKLAFRLAKAVVDTDAVSRELSARDRQEGDRRSAA